MMALLAARSAVLCGGLRDGRLVNSEPAGAGHGIFAFCTRTSGQVQERVQRERRKERACAGDLVSVAGRTPRRRKGGRGLVYDDDDEEEG
ncbi:hypothetical protein MRX96_039888 [Rhipicephalus microplus]